MSEIVALKIRCDCAYCCVSLLAFAATSLDAQMLFLLAADRAGGCRLVCLCSKQLCEHVCVHVLHRVLMHAFCSRFAFTISFWLSDVDCFCVARHCFSLGEQVAWSQHDRIVARSDCMSL